MQNSCSFSVKYDILLSWKFSFTFVWKWINSHLFVSNVLNKWTNSSNRKTKQLGIAWRWRLRLELDMWNNSQNTLIIIMKNKQTIVNIFIEVDLFDVFFFHPREYDRGVVVQLCVIILHNKISISLICIDCCWLIHAERI